MRDLLMLVLILGPSLYALRQPWVGVIVWTVLSLMNPHAQFGYASAEWPLAMVAALCTVLGLLFTRERQNPLVGAPVLLMVALTVWTTLTLPASLYLDDSLPLWVRSVKIWAMVLVSLALIDTRRKLNVLIWATTLSLAFYGVKGGLFTLATAGNYRVWGPGGFIGGNNEVALALIMVIPLLRYLQLQSDNRWLRRGLLASMLLCAVTVLGTYSRGALLGIAAAALFLWVKGSKKLIWGVLLLGGGAVMLSFMPDAWWERMNTIQTYEADDSALGRINAWWNAWNLARDRFTGGGFMIYFPEVFQRYSPDPTRVHAAHSIYFQMLGEHGFVGLLLFLLIGVSTWSSASKLIGWGRLHAADRWCADLGAMVQVSMIGFAIAGAFLSLAYYDLPYNIMAITVLAMRLKGQAPATAGASIPPAAANPPQTASTSAAKLR